MYVTANNVPQITKIKIEKNTLFKLIPTYDTTALKFQFLTTGFEERQGIEY